MLLFFILCDKKLIIFLLWADCQTKKACADGFRKLYYVFLALPVYKLQPYFGCIVLQPCLTFLFELYIIEHVVLVFSFVFVVFFLVLVHVPGLHKFLCCT